MNEKVNYTIFYSFLQKGFSVIRFNFRGIGGTEGVFEAGEGELTDASTVVDWIQEQNEEASDFWLVSTSFFWCACHICTAIWAISIHIIMVVDDVAKCNATIRAYN
jgi:alpha/beta superfamily hydrolase